ncbi:hypothetical protein ES703_06220 [subsurface metagenome]
MVTREFWKAWKRKTKLEIEAIKTLKGAKKLILKKIPKSKINSLYVKGTFIRREMNRKSDVDIVVIVKDNKYLKKVDGLAKECEGKYKPEVGISVRSLWELENNKHFEKTKKLRGRPDLFIKKVDNYKLIFGRKINPKKYPSRDDKKDLEVRIRTFRKTFIPLYRKKEMGFAEIIKQVFWLVELEKKVEDKNPPETWKKLDKSIKDKNHIMHIAYRYRLNKPKDKRKRENFIKKLEKYLKKLERTLKWKRKKQ